MKKSFYLLAIFVIAMFIGTLKVEARISLEKAVTADCTVDSNGNTVCNPEIVFGAGANYKVNTFTFEIFVSNATLDQNITYGNGLYKISLSNPIATTMDGVSGKSYTLVVGSRKTLWAPSRIGLGTFTFNKDDAPCSVVFTFKQPTFEKRNICEVVDGYYYDRNGNNVNEEAYRSSCLMCEKDESAGKYYGLDGRDLDSYEDWYNECGDKKYCKIEDNTYYGKDGSIVNKLEYYEYCEKPTCETVTENEVTEYYDITGKKVSSDEYQKSCFYCKVDGDTYYGKEGKVVDKLTYEKQCAVHTCEILSDGTHYNKEGKEVTEAEYLKSCYGCRKENNKYYDENGKETTEANWNAMCTPHKCAVIGDKYFDDKGKIVPKDVYDKACTNPKTGSIDGKMLAYIVSGVLLTGAILFVTLKNTKLRRL